MTEIEDTADGMDGGAPAGADNGFDTEAQLAELQTRAAAAAEAVRQLRRQNEVLQAEIRRALSQETIAVSLHHEQVLATVDRCRVEKPLRTDEDTEALREEVRRVRAFIEQQGEVQERQPLLAEDQLSGSSEGPKLTEAEVLLLQEKKALQHRIKALLNGRGGGSGSQRSSKLDVAALEALAAATELDHPAQEREGANTPELSARTAEPSQYRISSESPGKLEKKDSSSAAATATMGPQQWRRLRQLDSLAERLHTELKTRSDKSNGTSLRSSSRGTPALASMISATARQRTSKPTSTLAPSAPSDVSKVSQARSELRAKQLDVQMKALSRRFMMRRDLK